MTTVLKIGLADHGRPVTYEDFRTADWEEGYQYEIIDGKLYVSPLPDPPQGLVEKWIYTKVDQYAQQHPEVINLVINKARVFVPNRPGVTNPEPDLAAYRNFPLDRDWEEIRWEEVSPLLVAEVMSPNDPDKDLVRNVELYLQVPTIREYWILDSRQGVSQLTMSVYRRRGQRWQRPVEVGFGDPYATRLLPGFHLILNPRR
jgi:Uma2 family endonuclease